MLRLGADRTLLRIAFVFMRRRIPRQTGNGAVLTRSPAGDGGAFLLLLLGRRPACSEGYELEAPRFVLIEVTIPYV